MAFTAIPDAQVAFDAIISTDLFGKMKDNDDYLKSALTDDSGASQGIDTSTFIAEGNSDFEGTFALDGGAVTGTSCSVTPDAVFSVDMAVNGYGVNTNGDAFATTSGVTWDFFAGLVQLEGLGSIQNWRSISNRD